MQENETSAGVKVTIQKPTDAILAAANQTDTVTAGGKSYTLKKPGVLTQFRIVEVVGESAKNEVYMMMIAPLLWITHVDGEPEPPISTKRELEALIQRVGEDGIMAISEHVRKIASEPVSKEAVKN